ncbi:MAG: CAP domain-containing protein [Candidatus Absconditabacterales bacterium]|nr:CAP domain-containing protein [Candidatus Absconditabacterales bacterium]
MSALFVLLLSLLIPLLTIAGGSGDSITHESIRASLSPRDQIMFDRIITRLNNRASKMGNDQVIGLAPGLRQLANRPRTPNRLKPLIRAVAQAIEHQTFISTHQQPTIMTTTSGGGNSETTPTHTPTPHRSFSFDGGFTQVSNDNQDPRVTKIGPDGKEIWKIVHETSPVDTRAEIVMTDAQGNPWVVFTLDGGSHDAGYITRKHVMPGAFDGVVFPSFGRAQGAFKGSFLAKLDPETGKIVRGTFLMSRTTEGDINANPKANSLSVSAISFESNGNVIIMATSWFRPFAAGSTAQNYRFHPDAIDSTKNNGSWNMRITLDPTLSRILDAQIIHPSLTSRTQSTPTPSTTSQERQESISSPVQSRQQEMLTAVNEQRSQAQVSTLTLNNTLSRVAQAHAEDMLAQGYFSHISQDGRTMSQRVTNAGYAWSFVGENIANGQTTVSEAMQSRMNSDGHRANILSPNFCEVGFGRAGNYRVQVFAAPK